MPSINQLTIQHTLKAAKAAESELRKARRNFESQLAQNVKNDNKSFFAYSRSKTRCKTTLGPLINQSGELLKDPHELSQEFNNFFASVFTDEDLSDVPQATNMSSLVSEIDSIEIDEDRVRKCMRKLRADKSPGPDDISPRLLIPIAEEIRPTSRSRKLLRLAEDILRLASRGLRLTAKIG